MYYILDTYDLTLSKYSFNTRVEAYKYILQYTDTGSSDRYLVIEKGSMKGEK